MLAALGHPPVNHDLGGILTGNNVLDPLSVHERPIRFLCTSDPDLDLPRNLHEAGLDAGWGVGNSAAQYRPQAHGSLRSWAEIVPEEVVFA
jgi:hypothetical protein